MPRLVVMAKLRRRTGSGVARGASVARGRSVRRALLGDATDAGGHACGEKDESGSDEPTGAHANGNARRVPASNSANCAYLTETPRRNVWHRDQGRARDGVVSHRRICPRRSLHVAAVVDDGVARRRVLSVARMDLVYYVKLAVYVGVPLFGAWWAYTERRTMQKLKEKAGIDDSAIE